MSTSPAQPPPRTPARKKARELARYLRTERPDYAYLKEVFRYLRQELDVSVPRSVQRLPYVPSEDEIRRYYQAVWKARRSGEPAPWRPSWPPPSSTRSPRRLRDVIRW